MEATATGRLLVRLYSIPSGRLRDILLRLAFKIEGGDFYSPSLREIFRRYHDIEVGMYSYGGCFDLAKIPPGTRVGRYGSFSSFRVFSRNHPMDYISTHPFFFNTSLGYLKEEKFPHTRLTIGHDVWIGYNALILPTVDSIGNGAVIGAGAVVTKNVPPYAIVAGNPARVIRLRLSEGAIAKVEGSRWWEKDIGEIRKDWARYTRPFEG